MGSTVARKSEKLTAKASLRDTGTIKFDLATDTTVFGPDFVEVSLYHWSCFPTRNRKGVKLYHLQSYNSLKFSDNKILLLVPTIGSKVISWEV